MSEMVLHGCPFCGQDAVETFCCGLAIENCPRCSPLFGCNHCDVWMDTADEWNTRKYMGKMVVRPDLVITEADLLAP